MIRKLIFYGHPILRQKSASIEHIGETVQGLVQDLIDTAFEWNAAGLAAPQIGASLRLFVCRYENSTHVKEPPVICSPKIYINPVLSNPS